MTRTLHFLSWLRTGLATRAQAPTDGEHRARVDARLTLRHEVGAVTGPDGDGWAGGSEHPDGSLAGGVTFAMAGPEDVIGLSDFAMGRRWPPPETGDMEPNLFPLVEFTNPELPWRYSPASTPGTDQPLKPWIALVVASDAEITDFSRVPPRELDDGNRTQDNAAPERVTLRPGIPLPDLDQCHAWAHVQAPVPLQAPVQDWLLQHGDQVVARLLAARRLAPFTRYRAMVVPTWERGRLAGLGLDLGTAFGPAWAGAAVPDEGLTLPIYLSWTFSTGEAQDFESLASGLAPNLSDGSPRGFPMHVPVGGKALIAVFARGALQPVDSVESEPEPEDIDRFANAGLPVTMGEDGWPVVGPPLYGSGHIRRSVADPADSERPWFAELNRDPRWRVAAGLGAEVVRTHQEALMERLWDQLATWREENQRIRGRRTARALGRRVRARHVDRAPPESKRLMSLLGAELSPESVRGMRATAGALDPQYRRQRRPGNLRRRMGAGGSRTANLGLEATLVNHGLTPIRIPLFTTAALLSTTAALPFYPMPPVRPNSVRDELMRRLFSQLIEDSLDPTLPDPKLHIPTWRLLEHHDAEWLLPGLSEIPVESVTLLKPDTRFVEAFMAGMNHEMAREMTWREYPTDGRRTVLDQFWGAPRPEIDDIHRWRRTLGNHQRVATPPLVLVLRSELIRRYPGTALFALPPARGGQIETPLAPIFGGRLGPDTAFFGFPSTFSDGRALREGWFVLQEPAGQPRFGADLTPQEGAVGPGRWDRLHWEHLGREAGGPYVDARSAPDSGGWDPGDGAQAGTAAALAAITLQPQFQVNIAAPLLLDRSAWQQEQDALIPPNPDKAYTDG